jgi:dTMP kinase
MPAQFITIEGGEGVGKTTNLQLIQQVLGERGIDFYVTREPGGTPMAEELREVLLRKREEKVDPYAELLTMFAARRQHLETVIKPKLANNIWVVSDRFTDASFAYQGAGRQLDWRKIELLEQEFIEGFKPNKTFLLDVNPRVGLQRATERSELDRFESEKMAFFERVRQGYFKRQAQEPERFCLIDAGNSLQQVQMELREQLNLFIDSTI